MVPAASPIFTQCNVSLGFVLQKGWAYPDFSLTPKKQGIQTQTENKVF